jgi:osmoprotectant transport system permease protein
MTMKNAPLGLLLSLLLLPCWPANRATAAEKPKIRIGSKAFTEGVILGEMLTALAKDAGGETTHLAELGGSQVLWKALQKGDIDAYVDYTGTLTEEILAGKAKDEDGIRELLQKDGVGMSGHIGFYNNYALGMREDRAEKLHIKTISDLKDHPNLTLGVSEEFLKRKDAWPSLKPAYGLPQTEVRSMDHMVAYRGLAAGSHDISDLYLTDAEVGFYKFRVLQDDRRHFPFYYAVIVYRLDLAKRAPQVLKGMLRLEGQITTEAMTNLNIKVQMEKIRESQVAVAFLNEQLKLDLPMPAASNWLGELWRNTREHLFLVCISLTAAVLVSVPLGVYSSRRPNVGRFILGVVGVIQTMPSLALLVFMIPFFGLGAWPAIVALFLYSLLPIVRNTATGLQEIPGGIHESAQVLGLPSWERLWRIELPMASRSILGGIKTAAVINVGTATLGALIGAGGFGQPIQTGIRLSDYGLILQGAVPAALLAVLVQALFGLAEKVVVPKGLRIASGS